MRDEHPFWFGIDAVAGLRRHRFLFTALVQLVGPDEPEARKDKRRWERLLRRSVAQLNARRRRLREECGIRLRAGPGR